MFLMMVGDASFRSCLVSVYLGCHGNSYYYYYYFRFSFNRDFFWRFQVRLGPGKEEPLVVQDFVGEMAFLSPNQQCQD